MKNVLEQQKQWKEMRKKEAGAREEQILEVMRSGNQSQQEAEREKEKLRALKNLENQQHLLEQIQQNQDKKRKIQKMSETELLLNKPKFEKIAGSQQGKVQKAPVQLLDGRNKLRNFD